METPSTTSTTQTALPPEPTPTPAEAKTSVMPILGWIKHYWIVILIAAIFLVLSRLEAVWNTVHSLIFTPTGGFFVIALTYLARQLVFKKTIAKDVATGKYVASWDTLPDIHRHWLTFAYTMLIALVFLIAGLALK